MSDTIWPNFYVVGGVKCGTTSIWAHLRKHPQVFLPDLKEPLFFMGPQVMEPGDEVVEDHCAGDEQKYLNLYRSASGFKAIGDASPGYLWESDAPKRIHAVRPDARIIISVRDPISRAYSRYLMNLIDTGVETLPFYEALQVDRQRTRKTWWGARLYVECGLYYEQVRRYFEVFGRDQVLVLPFEQLSKNPLQFFQRIAAHIGIDSEPLNHIDFAKSHNTFRKPRFGVIHRVGKKLIPAGLKKRLKSSPVFYSTKKPDLDERSREYLQKIFDPDVCKLEDLLGRKLPELRKSWVELPVSSESR